MCAVGKIDERERKQMCEGIFRALEYHIGIPYGRGHWFSFIIFLAAVNSY